MSLCLVYSCPLTCPRPMHQRYGQFTAAGLSSRTSAWIDCCASNLMVTKRFDQVHPLNAHSPLVSSHGERFLGCGCHYHRALLRRRFILVEAVSISVQCQEQLEMVVHRHEPR
ncbi:hypothetical protein H310_13422 [Aphanomyces invadans]|uniref:Uncharacterized protein n=1 Tax=Aphanomyces invadans TaxID=157072 RepID=A0A024TDD6_9STRA|nr:hypothetical protein H310_13422 [Aphanomyces invadans]ETV92175.1 hypothetical protein H310_13422 [Aphanomyces invadans]|eukprot:XP_008879139.1 hypothetical protein H310_13422 [Aphanomyces invadans]